jgi:hypothetical protein
VVLHFSTDWDRRAISSGRPSAQTRRSRRSCANAHPKVLWPLLRPGASRLIIRFDDHDRARVRAGIGDVVSMGADGRACRHPTAWFSGIPGAVGTPTFVFKHPGPAGRTESRGQLGGGQGARTPGPFRWHRSTRSTATIRGHHPRIRPVGPWSRVTIRRRRTNRCVHPLDTPRRVRQGIGHDSLQGPQPRRCCFDEHVPHDPGGGAQPGVGCLFRAVSTSSHKRHNLFRIRQLWWDRTHPCGQVVIVRASLWVVVAVGRDPQHRAGGSIPASLNPLGRFSAGACENHPARSTSRNLWSTVSARSLRHREPSDRPTAALPADSCAGWRGIRASIWSE